MRFLVTSQELNEMARNKGLMSPTKDLSFNSMYSAFGDIPESRILSPEEFGITDDAVIQLRMAVYGFSTGKLSIDEAVKAVGGSKQIAGAPKLTGISGVNNYYYVIIDISNINHRIYPSLFIPFAKAK